MFSRYSSIAALAAALCCSSAWAHGDHTHGHGKAAVVVDGAIVPSASAAHRAPARQPVGIRPGDGDESDAARQPIGRGQERVHDREDRLRAGERDPVQPADQEDRRPRGERLGPVSAELDAEDLAAAGARPEVETRHDPALVPALEQRFAPLSWEQLVAETLAIGSPDTVAAKIAEMRDLGVGEVLCWMNFGGLPHAHVRRSMELFAREVMPRFR